MQQIAVIDDDPEVIDLLTKWLNDIIPNCKIHPFSELDTALSGLISTDFDLVISDVDLGSGSDKFGGVKIAKALDTRRTPLLVISGFTVQEGVFRALDAWDYLQKPIDEGDFKTEVNRALVYRKGLTNTAEQTSEDEEVRAWCRTGKQGADQEQDGRDPHDAAPSKPIRQAAGGERADCATDKNGADIEAGAEL